MGEFANTQRRQAAQALRTIFQQDPGRGADPMIELIGLLLADEGGGVFQHPEMDVTTEQWFTWNRLLMERRRVLARMVQREAEREHLRLPEGETAMRSWAAQVLMSTLDRLGML